MVKSDLKYQVKIKQQWVCSDNQMDNHLGISGMESNLC